MVTRDADAAREALLFVPDISGFTQFVQSTEIEHARHIVEELLETLIEANEIGLEVSEIEGDAILFYRFGAPPSADELFAQAARMFVAFHGHLRRYETQRICQCGACVSAMSLTLKIVAHRGAVAESRVGEHAKLFGQDVITVHRLLKNELDSPEYLLVTRALTSAWPDAGAPPWSAFARGAADYDVGRVEFEWAPLAPLRTQVPDPRVEDFSIPGATIPVFSCEQVIDAPLELVFEVTADLPGRLRWMEGATDIEMLNDRFNRVGTRHRCLVDANSPVMVTSGSTRDTTTITLTETDEKRNMCSVYVLERDGEARTRVRIDGFLKDAFVLRLLFALLLRRKLTRWFEASSTNLKRCCESVHDARRAAAATVTGSEA